MTAKQITIIRPESHEAWLKARESGIGASEVGTILGVNPYDTPYRLWRRRIGVDEPVKENLRMQMGHVLEDAVAQLWQRETGRTVIKASKGDWIIRDTQHPYLQVSPDRTYWIEGMPRNNSNKGLLECKTTGLKVDTDNIPLYWFAQVQYQLMVSGYPQASLAWLINGRDFGYQDFIPLPEFHEQIREAVSRFWLDNIQGRMEPAAIDAEDVLLKFPRSTDSQVIWNEPTSRALDAYRDVISSLTDLEAEKKRLAGEIKSYMGESERLVDTTGRVLATWKTAADSTKFDEKRFKVEHPELWSQYQYTARGSRRFLVK